MVSSHCACGFAAGAALHPVYGGDCLISHSVPRLADVEGIVAAALNPAANVRPGARGTHMVSSHRACGFAAGAALLPVYGGDCLISHSVPRLADVEGIVAAGLNSAANARPDLGSVQPLGELDDHEAEPAWAERPDNHRQDRLQQLHVGPNGT